MNIKLENLGAIGIIVGIVGTLFAGYEIKKTNDVANKLNMTLKDLEGKTGVDLQEDVVNAAMMNAVEKKTKKIVDVTAVEIRDDYRKTMKNLIKKEIDKDIDDIHDKVEDKVVEMVNNIDEEKFLEEVKADAKKTMAAKFNTSLDSIASEFKDQYKNLGKFVEMVVGNNGSQRSNNNRMYFGFGD